MSKETREITKNQHLTALALFTLGQQHYRKVREMERALHEVLDVPMEYGNPYLGCLSDELYNDEGGSFDEGLKKIGITIERS